MNSKNRKKDGFAGDFAKIDDSNRSRLPALVFSIKERRSRKFIELSVSLSQGKQSKIEDRACSVILEETETYCCLDFVSVMVFSTWNWLVFPCGLLL